MPTRQNASEVTRVWIARAFTTVEDRVYIGLGLVLGASAIALLGNRIISSVQGLASGTFITQTVALLDRILLILLIVELLYTVQVSFRENALLPEPFLLVGLIAAIRRASLQGLFHRTRRTDWTDPGGDYLTGFAPPAQPARGPASLKS